jgi:putative flippase GtrA
MRFILVGGGTAALYFGIFYLLVYSAIVHTTIAGLLACLIAIIFNYVLHYSWTFASNAPHGKVLYRYLAMQLGSLCLNGLIIHYGIKWLPVHFLIVQCLAAVATIFWNLCLSSLWVYRQP